jgi:hypothetical protein
MEKNIYDLMEQITKNLERMNKTLDEINEEHKFIISRLGGRKKNLII